MRINYNCLPCLIHQVVKVAELTDVSDKDELFHKIFEYFSQLDFQKTNPEIIGESFQILKTFTNNGDPYQELRTYYNNMFLELSDSFEHKINLASNSLECAIKYAIVSNIIDFNPAHNNSLETILSHFEHIDNINFSINHTSQLIKSLNLSQKLLYIGDNCGEICLDKLFLKYIKQYQPDIEIYFAVRGVPVVNDSIEEDAYHVGINTYAKIVSNGDSSLGTVLPRTSKEFRELYESCDMIISKGQANYESLSEETHKNIFFLLITKCDVIADDIGVPVGTMVCKAHKQILESRY